MLYARLKQCKEFEHLPEYFSNFSGTSPRFDLVNAASCEEKSSFEYSNRRSRSARLWKRSQPKLTRLDKR